MKTFLVVLAAAVLAALLVWVLICYFLPCPPRQMDIPQTDTTRPSPTCEDYIGRGPREAVVKVKMDTETEDRGCKLKTSPNKLDTCVGDELFWEAAYVGDCTGYSGDLVIRLKEGENERDLEIIEASPSWVRGRVPHWPAKCEGMTKCTLDYSVLLQHTDPSQPPLEEDPHVVIWE